MFDQFAAPAWPLMRAQSLADDVSVNFNTSVVRSASHFRQAEEGRLFARSQELVLRSARFWSRVRVGTDLLLVALAAAAAGLSSPHVNALDGMVLWSAIFAAIVICLSYQRGSYARRTQLDTLDDLRSTGVVVAIATSIVVTARVLLDSVPQNAAGHSVRLGVFAVASIACGRVALNLWQSQTRRQGKALVPTLIVGAGHIGRTTARRLLEHPELGLKPIGYLDKEPMEENGTSMHLPVLGASWDFDRIAAEHGVGQVVVTFSTAPSEVLLRIVNRCEQLGISVALVPRLFEKVTERLTIEHLGGLPLITSHPSNPRGWQFAIKYMLDRIVSLVIVVLMLPVLIGCALGVMLTMGRPILFRQRRVGLDGREFDMLKFRSMRGTPKVDSEADAAWLALQLQREAPADPVGFDPENRRTWFGAILRKTSLDELPQLFNVLKGEMSLVGPRPERTSYVEQLESEIYRYGDRHRVRAGITGWAQVNGLRGQTSLADRVEWDNYYIENASLWLDFKIVGLTIIALLRGSSHAK
jgi:exopolysaccharide biosynthesis polyprenyl glycosylphosphotransferase